MDLVKIHLEQPQTLQACTQGAHKVRAPEAPRVGHEFGGDDDVFTCPLEELT